MNAWSSVEVSLKVSSDECGNGEGNVKEAYSLGSSFLQMSHLCLNVLGLP